jgi:nicotinamidase-related amidase
MGVHVGGADDFRRSIFPCTDGRECRWQPRIIVLIWLTVKRFSADLSLPCASVICTQLERNNNFKNSKGKQTMTTPTYNRLNKDDAIVLLVDHQTGLISLVQDFSPNEFKNNVLALADLAKFFELPTILTTSFEQGPNGPLVPELKEMFPDAPYIARPGQINAWDNEDFVKAIKATGRKQIIIAGVVTDVCVAFPTLSALAEGFDVFVVTDASGTFNTTVQQAAWSRMTQAGAQMMNWFSVACELHRDWRNDIEGLGNLLSQRIPNYRNLMNGYSALTAQQK